MKNLIHLAKFVLIFIWGVTTFVTEAQESDYYLWPIVNKQTGDGIIYKPGEYIDGKHNGNHLFIGAPEGTYIVAPCDGVISYTSYDFYISLQEYFHVPIGISPEKENLIEPVSKIIKDDQEARKSLAKRFSERKKMDIDPKDLSIGITITVAKGEKYSIIGTRPIKYFKTGTKVKRGDTIGMVGYAYRKIPEACIGFSRSINRKAADPMSIFGIESTFRTFNDQKINYYLKKYSVKDLREDFTIVRESLEEGHPGLYDYCTKDELDAIFEETLKKIDKPMTSEEFRSLILSILKTVKDSHSSIKPTLYAIEDKLKPPVLFGMEGNKLKIYSTLNEYKYLLGKQIVKINGEPVESIIPKVRNQFFGSDGFVESVAKKHLMLNFWKDYFLRYNLNEKRKIILSFLDGDEVEIFYKKITKKDKYFPKNIPFESENRFETKRINENIALLDLNSFHEYYETEIDELIYFLKEVSDSGIRNLIIDLRDNHGGSSDLVSKIFSIIAETPFKLQTSAMVKKNDTYSFFKHTDNYSTQTSDIFPEYEKVDGKKGYYLPDEKFPLVKPNANVHYSGNVFLLINEESFSASTIFAGLFKKFNRGFILGRETGSAYHQQNGGSFAKVILANTHLIFRFPLIKGIINDTNDRSVPWGRGVIPDYTIEASYEEFIDGNDKIMKATLSLIDELDEAEQLKKKEKARNTIILLSLGFILLRLKQRKKGKLKIL